MCCALAGAGSNTTFGWSMQWPGWRKQGKAVTESKNEGLINRFFTRCAKKEKTENTSAVDLTE
jgi:hypothetical protein